MVCVHVAEDKEEYVGLEVVGLDQEHHPTSKNRTGKSAWREESC